MRKEIDITIADEGRDLGKVFHLREMPAAQAEKWALKALFLAARSGVDIPDNVLNMGMQGIAFMGIQVLMRGNFFDAEPLLDEMMACVSIKPDPRNPSVVRVLTEDDIEEIATRVQLRREILQLHASFFTAGNPSMSTSTTSAAASGSGTTPTSPTRLVRRSRPAK